MDGFKDFLKSLLTEVDGESFDVAKLLAALSILAGITFQGYVLYKQPDTKFDMQNYGTGIGLLFAGVGVALHMKKDAPINNG
jgi:hypothetical protein